MMRIGGRIARSSLVVLGLLLVVGAVPAVASTGDGPMSPDAPQMRAPIAAGQAYWAGRSAFWASPAGAQQRSSSATAYGNQSSAQSLATDRAAFPEALSSPVMQGLGLLPGQHVERFLGAQDAAVLDAAGKRSFLHGSLPLRGHRADGSLAPLDMRLVDQGSMLAPTSSLVDVAIPKVAAGSIRIGDLGVRMVGTAGSDANLSQDRAFYGNVGPDTDAVLVAVPGGGVELSYVLRSPASLQQDQRLAFDLPAGASLVQSTDTPGAVEITRDGAQIGLVAPPKALDAQGRGVGVSYHVDDPTHLSVHVASSGDEHAFPIWVDPAIVSYGWFGHLGSNWSFQTNNGGNLFSRNNNGYLGVIGYYNGSENTGAWGYWNFWSQPGAYINYLNESSINHTPNNSEEYGGLWSDTSNQINTGFHPQPESGSTWVYSCGTGASCGVSSSTQRNQSVFGLYMLGLPSGSPPSPQSYIYSATVQETDDQIPTLGSLSRTNQTSWVNNYADSVSAPVSVPGGLGLGKATLSSSSAVAGSGTLASTDWSCSSPVITACPMSGTANLSYNTSQLTTGVDTVVATAQNLVGNPAPQAPSFQIKVDHTAPVVQEAGDLWGAPQTGGQQIPNAVIPGAHTLIVNATDGSSAAPQSGVDSITMKITDSAGRAMMPAWTQSNTSCGVTTDSCGQSATFAVDTSDTAKWVPGNYTITVTTPDRANTANTQIDSKTLTVVSDNGVGGQVQGLVNQIVGQAGNALHTNVGGGAANGVVTFASPGVPALTSGAAPTSFTLAGSSEAFTLNTAIAGFAGSVSLNGHGSSSSESASAGSGTLTLTDVKGDGVTTGNTISCADPAKGTTLTGGYTRVGTHVEAVLGGSCTINGGFDTKVSFTFNGEFVPTGPGAGVTSPITQANFAGAFVVTPG